MRLLIGSSPVPTPRKTSTFGTTSASRRVRGVLLGPLLLVPPALVAVRPTGSNNPDVIEIKKNLGPDGHPVDGIPFHPYYTVKDIFGVGVFFILFTIIVFFVPTFGGLFLEGPNFDPANPMSTPEHIAPVWYFTPYYAILRAVPDQRMGALLMGLAVVLFLFLPWLDRSPVKSMRYRGPISKLMLTLFAIAFISLGYLGLEPPSGPYAAEEEKGGGLGSDWKTSHAGTDVENKASLQRGARNFANYCLGCHSLKYERWSRLAKELGT